ncbi:palmitoyl protein thioesterase [Ancylostoma ceylanicum]|uniref:Palmitoyl-protein thioesterase 1 n=1 Tax=Ancylostoma ceylanicum TaxID=53326 RepID=A0A0D6M1B4_9BILA|nr:palmitoyl protein thioesterase [Ancylostoma ceylanicum]
MWSFKKETYGTENMEFGGSSQILLKTQFFCGIVTATTCKCSGDCCCNPLSMGYIKGIIEDNVEGIYVKSLMLGENLASDTERGFLANMNELVENACEQIRNDSLLQFGYNAIGFSQGGQFLVVQAQYWHDPLHEDEYRKKSIFLADINNERDINQEYKKNLLNLKNLLLIKFKGDNMVVPKESSFGTKFYRFPIKDRIGLRKLDETGRLHFLAVEGDHLKIDKETFIKEVIEKFLK